MDSRNVTLYIYPLACSLFASSAIAHVRGDGKLESLTTIVDRFNTVQDPAKPFIRSPPALDNDIERQFANLTQSILTLEYGDVLKEIGESSIEFAWVEYTLMDLVANSTGISAVEDGLAYIVSLVYALIVQGWRDELETSGYSSATLGSLASSWVPSNVTLQGTRAVPFARLKVDGRQLVITFISTMVLVVVTIVIIMHGRADSDAYADRVVRDGGVIDIMSLMAGSSLPMLIGEESKHQVGGRDGRRVMAERVRVS